MNDEFMKQKVVGNEPRDTRKKQKKKKKKKEKKIKEKT